MEVNAHKLKLTKLSSIYVYKHNNLTSWRGTSYLIWQTTNQPWNQGLHFPSPAAVGSSHATAIARKLIQTIVICLVINSTVSLSVCLSTVPKAVRRLSIWPGHRDKRDCSSHSSPQLCYIKRNFEMHMKATSSQNERLHGHLAYAIATTCLTCT